MYILFRKPFFWHPDKLQKNYFRTPTHYLCFFKIPKKQSKQTKILDQVLTQPWTKFWRKKNPNLGPSFYATAHIYIYIERERSCWRWWKAGTGLGVTGLRGSERFRGVQGSLWEGLQTNPEKRLRDPLRAPLRSRYTPLVGACLATGDRTFATGSNTVSKCVLRSCACFAWFHSIQSLFERAPEAQNILR